MHRLSSLLRNTLEGRGHEVLSVSTEQEIIDVLRNNRLDLGICRISNDSPLFKVLEKCKSMEFYTPAYIFITKDEIDISTTQRMLRLGAASCLREPVNVESILDVVNESLNKTYMERSKDSTVKDMKKENEQLKKDIKAKTRLFNYLWKDKHLAVPTKPSLDVLGTSNVMLSVRNSVNRLSKSSLGAKINVFISGPEGSGKEILAKLIHELGTDSESVWIPVDCNKGESVDILNKKIFSSKNNPGLLEMANNGCIFFNEITNLPISIQEKLCDVIQKKNADIPSVHTNNCKTRFRVISATSKDIQECIENGTFLETLYDHLNSITMELPALNQQSKEDLLKISEYLLREIIKNINLPTTMHFEDGIGEVLASYGWPRNIDELQNAIQRACVLTEGNVVTKSSMKAAIRRQSMNLSPISLVKTPSFTAADNPENRSTNVRPSYIDLNGMSYHSWKRNAVMKVEKEYLQNQLRKYEGNCSAIAKEMKITRPNLCRLLKKHNLSAKHYRWLKKQKREAA